MFNICLVLFLNRSLSFFCDICIFNKAAYLNFVFLGVLLTGHWTVGRVRYLKDFGVLILEVN